MPNASENSISSLDIYKVQADRISNLNTTLYQTPPIFSTVIGGLWYFAATQITTQRAIAVGSFLFAIAVGLVGAASIYRLRLSMNEYYQNLEKFEGEFSVKTQGVSWVPSTVKALTALLLFSSFLSAVGAIYSIIK
jgi:hypothetical protein